MKRSAVLMILLAGAVLATALVALAAPKFIHYQGYLTDGSGNPVPDDPPLSIRFAIYNDIGDSLWGETKTVSTNNGKFNVKLGEDNDFPKDLFFDEDRWLGIKVGTDAEMTPRTLLGSVPYAFMAGNVPDTSIGSGKIKKNSIVDSLIADTTIGKDKIKHKSIIDSLIADTTIGKDKIKHKSIIDSLIADTTIGKDKIRKKSIIDSLIADTTIGKDKIRNKAIVDSLIDDEAIKGVHIRDDAIEFRHIAPNGANIDQIMKWDGGSWEPADDDVGAGDNDWELVGNALYTGDRWGIARAGNMLYGIHDSTHVNLGVACTTGYNLGDYKYITVSGGIGNKAEGEGSVIAGGGGIGTMGGNWITGDYCVIGGGSDNFAGDAAPGSGVPFCATIAGGRHNDATGRFSVVSGGGGDDDGQGNNASGDYSVISGGMGNLVLATLAAVGGGGGNRASGDYSVIGGGGGESETSGGNIAGGHYCVVGGGQYNQAGGPEPGQGMYATVGGGRYNQATGEYSVVSGGGSNESPYNANKAIGSNSVVAGGEGNEALGVQSVVSGGSGNEALGGGCAVGGGSGNVAGSDAPEYDVYSTVGGGFYNLASGDNATVGGGGNNAAVGSWSTVPGGYADSAMADYSFAGGYLAKVQMGHEGTFVWSDNSQPQTFQSTLSHQFLIRAGHGVGINTNSPTEDLDVMGNARIRSMPSGVGNSVRIDGTGVLYQQSSSRRHKDHIRDLSVDAEAMLRLNPVSFQWKSTGDDDFGLIAEDVAELLPQLVVYDSLGRPNGVKYDQLSVLLLGVVKQQQAAIDKMQQQFADNSALNEQVSQLRALVEVLLAERKQSTGGSDELVMGK